MVSKAGMGFMFTNSASNATAAGNSTTASASGATGLGISRLGNRIRLRYGLRNS